jgi:transposase-like protein
MSYRDIVDLLAERGVDVTNETFRCWTLKFGPAITRNLRRGRPSPTPRWHLDEMVAKLVGVRRCMWRAVHEEGEVLDVLTQKRRHTHIEWRRSIVPGGGVNCGRQPWAEIM